MAGRLRRVRLRRRALAVALLSWSACGPRRLDGPTDTASQGDSSASESTATENVASLEDSDVETSVELPGTSTDDGATTQGEICETPSFPDDPASKVLLRIQNDTAAPIFLRGPDCYHELFAIDPPDGVVGDVTWSCNLTCADAVAGGFCTCEGCAFGFTRIEPGIQYATQWTGRLFAALELPPCAACREIETCQTPFTAPAGIYGISIEVFAASADCGAACECEAGRAHCRVEAPVLEPTSATFSIDVDHPTEPDVLIVVE